MFKKVLAVLAISMLIFPQTVKADEFYYCKATGYCLKGTTATGTKTRPGVLAGKPEWFGKTAMMWEYTDGLLHPENFLGIYTVEDTGSESIRNGNVVDVWIESYEECIQFGCKKVIIQIIESEG